MLIQTRLQSNLARFSPPAYLFDINADKFDADPYAGA